MLHAFNKLVAHEFQKHESTALQKHQFGNQRKRKSCKYTLIANRRLSYSEFFGEFGKRICVDIVCVEFAKSIFDSTGQQFIVHIYTVEYYTKKKELNQMKTFTTLACSVPVAALQQRLDSGVCSCYWFCKSFAQK